MQNLSAGMVRQHRAPRVVGSDGSTGDMSQAARSTLFSCAKFTVDLLRIYRSTLNLDVECISIFLHVTERARETYLYDQQECMTWNRSRLASKTLRTGLSRRSIAVATGLSRETTRRKVTILLDRGFLVEDAFGSIRLRDEGWAADAVMTLTTQLDDAASDFLKLRSDMPKGAD